MKKFFIFLCFIIIVGVVAAQGIKNQVKQDFAEPVSYPSRMPTNTPSVHTVDDTSVTESLFVPYWAVSDGLRQDDYDRYFYFGVVPGAEGIQTNEEGATRVDAFLNAVPKGKESFLTLRMLDSTQNAAILRDQSRQKKLIASTIAFAKEKGFSGIVLDLEMSALPFDSLVQQITVFTTGFATETKKQGLSFAMTSYGDTFYRLRPFDIKALSENVDAVVIMAYDFHKARGNPGPNFPLHGKEVYGYDMTQMINDYLAVVPAEKIHIMFGMFGYDWVVDEKGTSREQGKPLTYHQIKQKFLSDCPFTNCEIKRKQDSAETKITYTDASGNQHVLWFEDPESVRIKQEYLKSRGISSFGYWAYSYF